MIKKHWGIILVLFFSYWAIIPLFRSGFFSMHDDTQVVRVYEMAKALQEGQFPVRWVADLGYGFGYPIFNFYSPLPYYVGGFFNLVGFDALTATKIMFVLGILLSGIFMYFLAREIFGEIGGIISSLFYMYAPYHAVDIYVRGAVGEFWAMAFIPIVFLGFYKVFKYISRGSNLADTNLNLKIRNLKNEAKVWKGVVLGSVGFAGVILSHNLIALMTMIFLAIIVIVLFYFSIRKKDLFIFYCTLSIILLGLGLSAFFWLPAIWEMGYTNVSSQIGGGADFRDHFVCLLQLWDSSWGFGGSIPGCLDGMSFKIGKLHILFTGISLSSALWFWKKGREKAYVIVFVLFCLLFSVFMMTEFSLFVWENLSILSYIQYPWRFLAFVSFFISLLVGSIFLWPKKSLFRVAILCFLSFVLLVYNIKYFQPQKYLSLSESSNLTGENIKWTMSRISDEYLPEGFFRPVKKEEVVKEKLIPSRNITLSEVRILTSHCEFTVESEGEGEILVRTAFFPGWKVLVDGKNVGFSRKNGQILISTPSGKHQVEVNFNNTPVRIIGNIVSSLSLLFIGGGLIYVQKKED